MYHQDELRFHPAEILLSLVIKLAVVAAVGPPASGGQGSDGAVA
jgi:hypothetical protein